MFSLKFLVTLVLFLFVTAATALPVRRLPHISQVTGLTNWRYFQVAEPAPVAIDLRDVESVSAIRGFFLNKN